MNRRQITFRIRFISGLILLGAFLLVLRLYFVQIDGHQYYTARAESQYVHTKTELYDRGSIIFTTRDGAPVSAASIRSGYVLAANPEHILDYKKFCDDLISYLNVTAERCVERISAPGRVYVELADRLTEDQADEIDSLDIDGAQLYSNRWRYYPGSDMAARSIGFVGFSDEGNVIKGKYGLERYYDDVLYRDRQKMSVNFFAELFSNFNNLIYRKEDNDSSGDIITTLEPSVSRMLDSVLEETQKEFDSDLTGAIIMRPDTGEIVAMNAVPGFDLNNKSEASIDQFRNPLVENVYEFGSTIKALTVAAGLDSGAITPSTTYYDSGSIELDTFTISNFDGIGRGTVPMQEVLNQSLNTGVAFIVDKMGKDSFRDYFINFKLGSESGIDLPNEAYGLTENLNSPRDVEYATASFGQGIAMTPIATTRALATLANGGQLVTPHLAKRIEYDNGETKEIMYPEGDQVISKETSEEISRMLTEVVDDALLGGSVALPNHTVAAKTGTAQIPDSQLGGYYDDQFLHSFFGYFPAYEPEFIVFMYTVEPKGVRYASETLTLPFMDITKFLINYYSIPPDR